jgi:ABC-type glycerol-3-phosphate transport system substrate-binding protein
MAMTAALADPAVESEDLVVAEVPGGQPTLGAWLLAVPRASAHKDLAHEFVRFATSPDMIARSIALGNPSPRQSHYGRDGVMAEAAGWFQCQRSSLELARPRPALPDWREVESRLGGVLSRLYTGRFDDAPDPVAAAVDEVEAAGLVELMSVETGRGDASTASPGRDSAGCSEPHRIGRRSER